MFGLPDGVKACLFDMDGVVTQTAVVHAAAWKEMFDDFLRARAESTGTEFIPFDPHAEYDAYVDGKPRLDGTRSFPESRGIELPEGTPDDPPGTPAGVEAGRAGHFALVVGVDRVGQAAELARHGADIAVKDLAELLDKDAR